MFNLLYETPRSSFLKESLNSCNIENQYCIGYFDGKKDFEDILDRFLPISSTCFVKKALHSKELDHKRFSKSGKELFSILDYYLFNLNNICFSL